MSLLWRLLTCTRKSPSKAPSPTASPHLSLRKHTDLKILKIPNAATQPRLLFIGDIHGCYTEFQSLLRKLAYDASSDHLIILGDLIGKGPLGYDVLAWCWERRHDAKLHIIKGNHEVYLLGSRDAPESLPPTYKETAMQMTQEQWHWMESWPLIVKITEPHRIYGVHAGINVAKALEEHSVHELTSMRDIDPAHWTASDKAGSGRNWAEVWNEHQLKHVDESQRYKVIYGHDAVRGLQQYEYNVGLDTGAVYGRSLSALVYPSGEIVQVESERVYSEPNIRKVEENADAESEKKELDAQQESGESVNERVPEVFGKPVAMEL